MRRSRDIKLGLAGATAAALMGCAPEHPHYDVHRQCVNANQAVVDDRYCEAQGGSQAGPYPYRWYYYRGSWYSPASPGSRASGGSYDPPPGSGTVRGVFGGTAEGAGFNGASEGAGE